MLHSWKCEPECLFLNLWIKITGMPAEFKQENTWIIFVRDKNLLQDHFSNIHTSIARNMYELDRELFDNFTTESWVIYDKLL